MWSKSRQEKYFRTKIVRILVCHDVPSHPYGKLRPPLKLNFSSLIKMPYEAILEYTLNINFIFF